MLFIAIIAVAGIIAGVINHYITERKKMEKIKLEYIDKEIQLERIKQENYILENEEMRTVLDRIKADNKRLEDNKNSPWLIQETRERQLEKE